jgi:hypothetical protein
MDRAEMRERLGPRVKSYGIELAWIDPALLFEVVGRGTRSMGYHANRLLGSELISAKEAGWLRVRIEVKEGRPAATPAPA